MASNSCTWSGANGTAWTAPATGSWVHTNFVSPIPSKLCNGAQYGYIDCTATSAGWAFATVSSAGASISAPNEASIRYYRPQISSVAGTQYIEGGLWLCADSDTNPQNGIVVRTLERSDGAKTPAQMYCVAVFTVNGGSFNQWSVTANIADLGVINTDWIIKARVIPLLNGSACVQFKGWNVVSGVEPAWINSASANVQGTYSFSYCVVITSIYSASWSGNRYGLWTGWFTTGAEYWMYYRDYSITNITVQDLVVQNSTHATKDSGASIIYQTAMRPVGNGTGPRNWDAPQDYTSVDELIGAPDGLYVQALPDTNLNQTSFTLDNTPSYFGNMTYISILARLATSIATGDDIVQFGVRIVSRTNGKILAASNSGGSFQFVAQLVHQTSFTNYGSSFAYVNTTATKADWDDAEVEFQQSWFQQGGVSDGLAIRLDAIEFTGTFLPSGGGTTLVVQNATHGQTVESPGVTQTHSIVVNNPTHSISTPVVVLTQIHNLAWGPAIHSVISGSLDLVRAFNLVVDNSVHDHICESITLEIVHNLGVSDCVHTQSVPYLDLGQVNNLVVGDVIHNQTAGSCVLTQTHILSISTNVHVSTSDTVILGQNHILNVTNATQNMASGSPNVLIIHNLVVGDSKSSIFSESPAIGQVHSLVVQNSIHGLVSTSTVLTQAHNLSIDISIVRLSSTVVFVSSPILITKRGTGTATSGSTWANLPNAIDGVPGTDPATYATWTSIVRNDVGYLEITGYDFSSIPDGSTINSVTLRLRHYENNTTYISAVTYGVYAAGTVIGSTLTATRATSARSDSGAVTPTLAQLKSGTFTARVNTTHNNSTNSGVCSIDELDITVSYTLNAIPIPAQNSLQALTSEAPALTQVHNLIIQNGTHATKSDNIVLAQTHSIVIANAVQTEVVNNVVLTQITVIPLVVANGVHGLISNHPLISVTGSMEIASSIQGSKSTNVVLTQTHNLIVQNSVHNIDNPYLVLTQVTTLVVPVAVHSVGSQNVSVSQDQNLVVASVVNGTKSSTSPLQQNMQLIVGDGAHYCVSTETALGQVHLLKANKAVHNLYSDNLLPWTQETTVYATDCIHEIWSKNILIPTGGPRVWVSGNWQVKSIKVFDGDWRVVILKQWDGEKWEMV